MSHYQTLLQKVYELTDIQKAAGLLAWDREVNMPPKGELARSQQIGTLSRLAHNLLTSAEMGDLITQAKQELNGTDYHSPAASLIRYLERSYTEEQKVPAEFVQRRNDVTSQAWQAWKKAREENNFALFQPHLEKVVALAQELADLYGYQAEKYDALLDKYERGITTAEVRAIFDAVKKETVPLIQAIQERGAAVDDRFLHQNFPIDQQQAFARYAAEAIGYDFQRGHMGIAVHPFASSFGRDDCRITTRWYADFFNPGIFGTLHECGHAMYEQGTGEELARTPLARGTSSGIHESQSRMFENYVGRSWGFWQTHYPKLQSYFPEQLKTVTAEQFYKAVNKIQPSFIRVEADELTYNMHIILRFELEQALINGDLKVADLPAAWNDKMKALLGVVPPTDTVGCLQDIHWSQMLYGYFPTYALGNFYAAQLMEAAVAQNPAVAHELENGQTVALLSWLRENIHQPGRKYDPAELCQRATGRTLTHEPFVRYVTQKFTAIYQL